MTKKHITKKSRNSKLKEKYYINGKTHLTTEIFFLLHHSLNINKHEVLIFYFLENAIEDCIDIICFDCCMVTITKNFIGYFFFPSTCRLSLKILNSTLYFFQSGL